ncbi:MAG TPA: ABC transporter substrate-binding protein [Candidatus Micrarchaeia archaeon]|nr:ABC transporter substrate-binding protein [Candidatus Micrarchaeia archaeon]
MATGPGAAWQHARSRWLLASATGTRRRGRRAIAVLVGVLTVSTVAAMAAPRAAATPSGTVRWALPPGEVPDWIFPITSTANFSNVNTLQFQYLMYRPLYWFGENGTPVFNQAQSLGRPPVYSDGSRTVTITMRHVRWSDGHPVTTRDVEFWLRLLIANKAEWGVYVPGGWPDLIAGMRFETPYRFQITFTHPVNHYWALYNELSQIVPLPQHAWDRTSASGAVGNFDRTTAGARAVYRFLAGRSRQLTTYDTDPLWQVVDGPWRIQPGTGYAPATGFTTLVPNLHYWGAPSRVARFEEVPFTSDSAEFDALRSGSLDYGYLPVQDLDQRSYFASHGYTFSPWVAWGVRFVLINFTNPKDGPLFRQLYLRQAMQHLIDQPAYIRRIYHGYAYPTYGPVPQVPRNPFVTPIERRDPDPYDPAEARALLRGHGWTVHPNGTSVCAHPGSGPTQCGAGVGRGRRLAFTLIWAPGTIVETQTVEAMKSAFSAAGITLALKSSTNAASLATPCDRHTGYGCTWDLIDWSGGSYSITWSPDYYPTGGEDFACGAAFNVGGYCDPREDRYVAATHELPGLGPFYRYENYTSAQLPLLWLPTAPAQLSEISGRLRGALPQDPNLNIYPQTWSLAG